MLETGQFMQHWALMLMASKSNICPWSIGLYQGSATRGSEQEHLLGFLGLRLYMFVKLLNFMVPNSLTLTAYKWNQMDPLGPFGSICTLSELQTCMGQIRPSPENVYFVFTNFWWTNIASVDFIIRLEYSLFAAPDRYCIHVFWSKMALLTLKVADPWVS